MTASSSAPTRYVAFLRGINVGGRVKVGMADLRTMLTDLGYRDVATLLQSGNAVLTAAAKPDEVAAAIEKQLHADTGLTVKCVVRTTSELKTVLARDPYEGRANDPARYVVAFMDKAPTKANIASIDPATFSPTSFGSSVGRRTSGVRAGCVTPSSPRRTSRRSSASWPRLATGTPARRCSR